MNKFKLYFLPVWWYIFLTTLSVIGVSLFIHSGTAFIKKAGIILFSILFVHVIVFFIMQVIRFLLDIGDKEDKKLINLWSPTIVGILEFIMYVIALLFNYETFIGVWLLFKVAGQWGRWGQNESKEKNLKKINKSRRRFMHFLIGNALLLLLSFTVYFLIDEILF